jgi:putative endonuclease
VKNRAAAGRVTERGTAGDGPYPAPSFVYLLACRTPRGVLTYVGWTLDPDRRLDAHNSGKGAKSTRGRVWVIIHLERLETRGDAMRREWHLKRDRKLRKQLADAWLRRTEATA